MKDEDKTKAELRKELKFSKEELEKGLFKNIAEQKQTEQFILKNWDRHKEIFAYINKGITIYEAIENGKDFVIKDLNPAAEKFDHLKKEILLGKSILKELPESIHFNLFKTLQKIYKTGKSKKLTLFLNSTQQKNKVRREHYFCKLSSGEIVTVFDDISEKKQVKKELKDSEEYLKMLFNYAPDAYYVNDLKGHFVDGNLAAEKLTGYKKEELIGKNFLELKVLSDKDMHKAQESLSKNVMGSVTGPEEYVIIRKDKSTVTVEICNYPVKIKGDIYLLSIARDITERKQAEEMLHQYEHIVSSSSDMLALLDSSFHYLAANNAYVEAFKLTPEQLIGKTVVKVFGEENFNKVIRPRADRCLSGEEVNYQDWFNFPAYGQRYMDITYYPYFSRDNKVVGFVVNGRNITERKQAEEKLKKTLSATIETISKIVEVKDPYTSGHQRQVSQLAISIAREMDLSLDKIEGIRIASLIHDIGKIGVPTEILSKPTQLSDIEFSLIKEHSQIGYNVLKSNDFSHPIAQIILQHHERLDGSGYPQGLKGKDILIEACIIGVADVVEAMSSHRPYRPALGIDAALEEITQNKGILYDSEVVEACLKLFKEKGFKFE